MQKNDDDPTPDPAKERLDNDPTSVPRAEPGSTPDESKAVEEGLDEDSYTLDSKTDRA